jgi:phospholipid/cholesterol/gamma-HCH transport system ATP-binding protein
MILIKDLKKSYNDILVLNGLNLTVETGETVVILGRSGVGKSVLLKQIIGIEKPDKGFVEVDGVKVSNLYKSALYDAIKHMGMLFQGAALFDSMNIEDNIAFYLKHHTSYDSLHIKELVFEALKKVGLENVEKKMPSDLSGGMRKRAGLARLIVYRPKILLYDEPTTGLDPITAQQINELIVQIQAELKSTSIVVTHDVRSALHIGDRLALHENGKIAHVAKPDDFFKIENPTIAFLKDNLSYYPGNC